MGFEVRQPSRNMPKSNIGFLGNSPPYLMLLVGFGVLALPGLLWRPLTFVLPILFVCFSYITNRKAKQIFEHRIGDDIGTFAKSFDCRVVDTWIVRAVYEEFSYVQFPLRSTDRFHEDLEIDDEDLYYCAEDIAERAGIDIENTENNPYFDKVQTLGDLVMFLHHQPKLGWRKK